MTLCSRSSTLPSSRRNVPWLIHMCDMTHSYVWHDSFICVPWLIHMCAMTHSYMWHDSFICMTWLIHGCDRTLSYVTWLIFKWHISVTCDVTHFIISRFEWSEWLPSAHDSFNCVTWLIPLAGADFEIIPTNKLRLVKTLQSLASPRELAAAFVQGTPAWKSQNRSGESHGINTGQAAQLSDPEDAGDSLACDASLQSAPCIALRVLATLCKPAVLIVAENSSSTFELRYFAVLYPMSRSGTKSQSPPQRVHSCVWLRCVTWLIHMYDVNSSCVWHESFMCMWHGLFTCVIRLFDMSTHDSCVWHHSSIYVKTHSYVWHDSSYVWQDWFICVTWLISMCVTWLIHMCDMIDSYAWHDASVGADMASSYVQQDVTHLNMSYRSQDLFVCAWHDHLYVWLVSFIRATWIGSFRCGAVSAGWFHVQNSVGIFGRTLGSFGRI